MNNSTPHIKIFALCEVLFNRMFKKFITLFIVIFYCAACTQSSSNINNDVVKNYVLNSSEQNADGENWKMKLPPNFKVVQHLLSETGESMQVSSRYSVGSRRISAFVSAQELRNGYSQEDIYTRAWLQLTKIGQYEIMFGPKTITLSGKRGNCIALNVNNSVLVLQMTLIFDNKAYIMRCIGDSDKLVRVGYKCKDLLDRITPVNNVK